MTNQGQSQNQNQKIPTRLDAYWVYRRNNDGTMPEQASLEVSITSRITTPNKNETRQLFPQQTQNGKNVIRFSLPIEGERPISRLNAELGSQFPTDKTLFLEVSVMGYEVEKFQKREYLVGDRVALVLEQVKLYQYQTKQGEPRVKAQAILKTDLQTEKWRSPKVQQEVAGQQQAPQQNPNTNPSFGGGYGASNPQSFGANPNTNPSFGGGYGASNPQSFGANPNANQSFGGGFGATNTQTQQTQDFGGNPNVNPSFGGGFGAANTQTQQTQDFGAGLGGAPTMPPFGAAPSGDFGVGVSDNDLPF